MPHDPARAADARAWIEKATLDLRSAEADLAARPAIIGDALFHCQQAVEKALKGLLAWHDEPFRKTHDLAELGARVAGLEVGWNRCCVRPRRSHSTRGGTATRERRASRCAPRRMLRWRWHGKWWRLRCNGSRHPPLHPDRQIAFS
jgi:hypothetical protein